MWPVSRAIRIGHSRFIARAGKRLLNVGIRPLSLSCARWMVVAVVRVDRVSIYRVLFAGPIGCLSWLQSPILYSYSD